MILPVALLSACFLISASLGSEVVPEEEVPTTPLPNINNQTSSKTETIDFPDPCSQGHYDYLVLREMQLPGLDPFKVVCFSHLDEGISGWLNVYYNRHSDKPIFNRTYEDYERGFGNVDINYFDEFFIGLNRLHHLTSGKPFKVILNTHPGTRICDHFVVGDRSEGYKVKNIGNCTGEDVWILPKQGTKFSTFDQDEDGVPDRNLAKEEGYGWWFDPSMRPERYSIGVYIKRTD